MRVTVTVGQQEHHYFRAARNLTIIHGYIPGNGIYCTRTVSNRETDRRRSNLVSVRTIDQSTKIRGQGISPFTHVFGRTSLPPMVDDVPDDVPKKSKTSQASLALHSKREEEGGRCPRVKAVGAYVRLNNNILWSCLD